MTQRLIYATFYDGAMVILGDTLVYWQDSDGYNNVCSAETVATQISLAIGLSVERFDIDDKRIPLDWQYDDLVQLTINPHLVIAMNDEGEAVR